MDPITTSALVAVLMKVVDGASGEAGKETWAALTGLVKRTFGHRSEPAEATEELERHPGEEARLEALAESLATESRRDPDFAGALRDWLADAQRVSTGAGDVTNVIGGSARISGSVVQGRDFTGDITFGGRG
ncbi:MAG: hypothetical protein JWO67_5345 [Streptosporangiaceae bacterium]|nr:hypothetical protein [Streptosporangiaceae bacterium]